MEFRQWQRQAQRMTRLALNEMREAKMKWEAAVAAGFDAANEATTLHLDQQKLPELELSALKAVPGLLSACEKKYHRLISRCKTRLTAAWEDLRVSTLKFSNVISSLDSIRSEFDWIPFRSVALSTIKSVVESMCEMFVQEYTAKTKVKDKFLEIISRTKGSVGVEVNESLEVLLRIWLLEPELNKDVFDAHLTAAQTYSETDNFFSDQETQLENIRNEFLQRFRSQETFPCGSSYHFCGIERDPESQCVYTGHDHGADCSSDSCKAIQLNLNETYVRTPDELAFASMPRNVIRDICLTDDLESQFKDARGYDNQGFAPWVYFGAAETGVFRIWPGDLRRSKEDGDGCEAYDPRVRPWWNTAAWKPRNVVILLDLSDTMQENIQRKGIQRWKLSIDMINKFLDTLSDREQVNIITFNTTAQPLTGSARLLEATSGNVNILKRSLRRVRPDWPKTVDIGRALNLAFTTLGSRDNDLEESNRLCENHILLFTARRDCTNSAIPDCEAKEHFNLGGSPFLANHTSVFLAYADYLKAQFRADSQSDVSIFPFSFSPDANGYLSQLACHSSGINVDVHGELEKGVLEPLALMRGYFRKAALSVAPDGDSRQMVVSPWYQDDGGLGLLNTMLMTVFYRAKDQCPPLFYGVIGMDMPEHLYEDNKIDYTKQRAFTLSVRNWNGDRTQCSVGRRMDNCQLQVLRGRDAECVYRLEDEREIKCYRYGGSFYYINDESNVNLESAREACASHGGALIAPKSREERMFLSRVIAPDGVWIDLRDDVSEWYWPDNDTLSDDDRRNLERSRIRNLEVGAYLDPRSSHDNFQIIQKRSPLNYACVFDSEPPEDLCPAEDIRTVNDADFPNTIQNCDMEDCILENLAAFPDNSLDESAVFKNAGIRRESYSDIACCNADDLGQVCRSDDLTNSESTGDDYQVYVWISAAIALAVLLGCAGLCFCRMSPCFPDETGSKRRILLRRSKDQVEMTRIPYPFNTGPFDRDAADKLAAGKRPALVVNIEVKILDNGWEKVGGYGRVRQGEYIDPSGNVHKVAVKFVDTLAPNAAWEALKNEFDILSSIPVHQNIVKPIGAHWGDRSEKSQRYIVEELMHTNLGDMIHGEAEIVYPGITITYRHLINIFIDIATGLEHLHKHKIVHFDLKPKNVLLDQNLRAKIADFGCSKAKFDTYIALSQMGGTPPYMPPECWMLQYAQNNRTEVARAKIDVYSFGVVMWETLNGGHSVGSVFSQTNAPSTSTPPIDEETTREEANSSDVLTQRWEIKFQLSHGVPETLRNLVSHCVRADFDARPTCLNILETLKPMLDTEWADKKIMLA